MLVIFMTYKKHRFIIKMPAIFPFCSFCVSRADDYHCQWSIDILRHFFFVCVEHDSRITDLISICDNVEQLSKMIVLISSCHNTVFRALIRARIFFSCSRLLLIFVKVEAAMIFRHSSK